MSTPTVSPSSSRVPRRLAPRALVAALAAWLCAAGDASAQAISEVIRGGLAVDAVGMESGPTTFASGEFHIRLPRSARVRAAVMYSATLWNMPSDLPAGPAGSPRVVEVGTGAAATGRTLEGAADLVVDQSGAFRARWGTWRTDVTATVRGIVGPSAAGGVVVNVPVRERGDTAPYFSAYPLILGHTLVVEYELDDGPLRNVAVLELNAIGDDVARMYRLPGLIANRCPRASPLGETFAASLSVAFEYDNPYPAEENGTVTANGTTLTTAAGGADDWDENLGTHAPAPYGRGSSWAGLITAGSFGGGEGAAGVAVGSAVGVELDTLSGPVRTPPVRLDDELYDFRPFVADGDPTVTLRYVADTDSYLTVLAIQTLARASAADADGDAHLDAAEGDCAVDADADGTPDYLDLDSDNDCLPDAMETAAGRVSAVIPGAASANCPTTAPFCDRARGVCQCRSASDCTGAATPVCDTATRLCVACAASAQCAALGTGLPVCVTAGAGAGRCVRCTPAEAAACPAGRALCDPTTNTCVGCITGSDCAGAAAPVCDPTSRACRACAAATQPADCPLPAAPVCATSGGNAGRCVPCTGDPGGMRGACAAPTPLCSTSASAPNVCVGCNGDADCSGVAPVCDAATRACRACDPASTSDCSGATPACSASGATAGRCVQCTAASASACSGATPACDAAAGRCVQCNADAECAGATPVCDAAMHACRGCVAGDCAGARPVCAASGANAGRCAECAAGTAGACAAPMVCDPATNACVGCAGNADCRDPAAPVCNPATRACRACDAAVASDCGGDTPVCAAAGANAGRCVQCTAARRAACAISAPMCDDATNRCVGCTADADCGDGRRCEPATRRCEQVVVATPDAGVEDAAPPSMDGGAARGAFGGDGCGCRAAGGSRGRGAWALAALALLARRRRSRR